MTSGSASSTRDVVRDLDRPDVAALVALADREAADDRRVGRGDGGDLGGDLRVAVVALLARPGTRSPWRPRSSRGASRAARTERRRATRRAVRSHRHSMAPAARRAIGRTAQPTNGQTSRSGLARYASRHDRPRGASSPRSTRGARDHAAAAVRRSGWRPRRARRSADHVFRWASVTKLVDRAGPC